ncbi:MAG: helix-turn-helix transcriptional regulator [Hydrogenophaga sp.]|nr:helix-turn-helix transcriptional regulator [Hydrogenophaga sp.]
MRLRDYLQKHRLTQAAFGQRLHPPVTQGKVNHWINGTRRVSLAEALQIEAVTGGEVSPADLVRLDSAHAHEPSGSPRATC